MANGTNKLLDDATETIGNAFGLNPDQKKLLRFGLIAGTCYVVGRYVRSLLKK
jgi:hypothetical protein